MRSSSSAGFTLVETLVCLLVLSVLILLLLPQLSNARTLATRTASQADCRQLVMMTSSYSQDYQDSFPYHATEAKPWLPLHVKGVEVKDAVYFEQSRLAANLLYPEYCNSIEFLWLNESRVSTQHMLVISRLYYTYALFASTDYWRVDRSPQDLQTYRGTHWREVVFPSSKSLVVDFSGSALSTRSNRTGSSVVWITAAMDGHSKQIPDIYAPRSGLVRPYGAHGHPFMSTVDGLAGQDF
jgi:prepilin-type N-terminal cleavage/methylation domain-containing protein